MALWVDKNCNSYKEVFNCLGKEFVERLEKVQVWRVLLQFRLSYILFK